MSGSENDGPWDPGGATATGVPATRPGRDTLETNRHLLSLLVCPLTRAPLRYDAQAHELISPAAELAYPIRDGVPIMTVSAARPLSELEVASLRASTRGPR